MKQVEKHEPTVAEVRADCRKWRRLVANCLKVEDHVPPATEEQYRVLHGRILMGCRGLADERSFTELRRDAIRQLDELLRPWSSAEALTGAPRELVIDLVKKEADLEERLVGDATSSRLRRLILVALTAGLAGSMLTIIIHTWTAGLPRPLVESLWTLTGNVVARVRALDFAEKFVVAVILSWLFGTWLLSQVRRT